MTNGSNHERYFARIFDQAGYYVMRGASSGSGNYRGIEFPGPTDDRAQADVLTAGRGSVFLFEGKSGDPPHYFTADEIEALQWAARQAGGHALLFSRFPRDSFRIWNPASLHQTDSGSRRAKPDDDPLTVLVDPRSEADDPVGYHPQAVAHHGLLRLLQADEGDDLMPGDVQDVDGDDDD